MKISIIKLPTNYWLASGERLNDWVEWRVGEPLRDKDLLFVGSFLVSFGVRLDNNSKRL